MSNNKLLKLLRSVLGGYKELNNGEYSFKSPFKRHRKKKLQLQLDPSSNRFGYWNCWITDNSGKSLFSLFKKANASKQKMKRLADLIDVPRYYRRDEKKDKEYEPVSLPREFHPLWHKKKTPEYKHALHYLKKRGLTSDDIIKYQIGYCEFGDYANRVIIPSFDEKGSVNFFVGRTFFDEYLTYKNPNFPKTEIVGFENLISWNYPVVITEGVFDAIAVKRNAIPLFGKTIHEKLLNRFVRNNPPEIIIALDDDALSSSLRIVEKLLDFEFNVSVVDMPEGNDPADLGFDGVWDLIENRRTINFKTLVKYKLFG